MSVQLDKLNFDNQHLTTGRTDGVLDRLQERKASDIFYDSSSNNRMLFGKFWKT